MSIRNKINALSIRDAQKEIRLRETAHTRERRHVERVTRERVKFAQSTLGHGAERVGQTVRAVGTAGAAMLGVGGAALAATSVASAIRMDNSVRRMIIGSRASGTESTRDPDQLRKMFQQKGLATGLNPEDIAAGAAKYVSKTGNLEEAISQMDTFATVAQATGSSVEDIASAAADMNDNMGVKKVEEMQKALAILAFQGKAGKFELKDMAAELPQMSAMAAGVGITGVEGVQKLGGLLQVAQKGTGNAAESSTALTAMFKAIIMKSAKIQSGEAFGKGVDVFNGGDATKGVRTDTFRMMGDMIAASGGNLTQLADTFDIRGSKAINPMLAKFNEAKNATQGTDAQKNKAGGDAVVAFLEQMSNVKGDFGEIKKDATAAMQGFGVELETMNTQMKLAMSEELMPALRELAPELQKLIPYVGRAAKMFVELVKFFIDHPFASLATIVAVQLAADFAKAQLGNIAAAGLKRMLASGGGTGGLNVGNAPAAAPGFMGVPGTGNMLGAGMAGLAVGLTIGSAIITAGIVNFERGEAEMKTAGQRLNAIRDMTPAQAGEARKLVDAQRAEVFNTKKEGFTESLFGTTIAQSVGAAPSDVERKTQESFLAEMEAKLAMLEKSAIPLQQAAAALDSAAGKMAMNTPNRGNAPSPIK